MTARSSASDRAAMSISVLIVTTCFGVRAVMAWWARAKTSSAVAASTRMPRTRRTAGWLGKHSLDGTYHLLRGDAEQAVALRAALSATERVAHIEARAASVTAAGDDDGGRVAGRPPRPPGAGIGWPEDGD